MFSCINAQCLDPCLRRENEAKALKEPEPEPPVFKAFQELPWRVVTSDDNLHHSGPTTTINSQLPNIVDPEVTAVEKPLNPDAKSPMFKDKHCTKCIRYSMLKKTLDHFTATIVLPIKCQKNTHSDTASCEKEQLALESSTSHREVGVNGDEPTVKVRIEAARGTWPLSSCISYDHLNCMNDHDAEVIRDMVRRHQLPTSVSSSRNRYVDSGKIPTTVDHEIVVTANLDA